MPSHYKGTKTEIRALNAYINLTRAANSLTAALSNQLESRGLTVSQFGALEALYHLGPLHQHEIAAKLLKSGGNITMVINNLEKQGWVQRKQASDRRMLRIELTAKGRAQVKKVLKPHVAAITKAFAAVGPAEQESLREICRKLGLNVAASS